MKKSAGSGVQRLRIDRHVRGIVRRDRRTRGPRFRRGVPERKVRGAAGPDPSATAPRAARARGAPSKGANVRTRAGGSEMNGCGWRGDTLHSTNTPFLRTEESVRASVGVRLLAAAGIGFCGCRSVFVAVALALVAIACEPGHAQVPPNFPPLPPHLRVPRYPMKNCTAERPQEKLSVAASSRRKPLSNCCNPRLIQRMPFPGK
jgi:hypothetical protein